MSKSEQLRLKRKPHNISIGRVNGTLYQCYPGTFLEAGTVMFLGEGIQLAIDGQPIMAFEKDERNRLLLSLELFGEDDKHLMSIVRNEWKSGDHLPWDIEFGHLKLVLRNKARSIALNIDARERPTRILGSFWKSGEKLDLTDNGLVYRRKNIAFHGLGYVGGGLNLRTKDQAVEILLHPKIRKSLLIGGERPNYSRKEWVQYCLNSYKKFMRENGLQT